MNLGIYSDTYKTSAASRNSLSALTKFVPLSEWRASGLQNIAMNLKSIDERDGTRSRKMTRVTRHVYKTPRRFAVQFRYRPISNGLNKSTAVLVNGRVPKSWRNSVRSAIICSQGWAQLRLQTTQSRRTHDLLLSRSVGGCNSGGIQFQHVWFCHGTPSRFSPPEDADQRGEAGVAGHKVIWLASSATWTKEFWSLRSSSLKDSAWHFLMRSKKSSFRRHRAGIFS